MPNWCDTIYKCVGEKKEVKALYDILEGLKQSENSLIRNDFGNLWLGNLVHKLGGNWEECRCRGEIVDFNISEDDSLIISQYTAWCEQEGARQLIEKNFPSIKVYFQEIEPGCGVFYSNDSTGEYFPEKYFIEDDYDQYCPTSIEEAASIVSEIVGKTISPKEGEIEKAVKEYQEQNEDNHLYFSKFEVLEN